MSTEATAFKSKVCRYQGTSQVVLKYQKMSLNHRLLEFEETLGVLQSSISPSQEKLNLLYNFELMIFCFKTIKINK